MNLKLRIAFLKKYDSKFPLIQTKIHRQRVSPVLIKIESKEHFKFSWNFPNCDLIDWAEPTQYVQTKRKLCWNLNFPHFLSKIGFELNIWAFCRDKIISFILLGIYPEKVVATVGRRRLTILETDFLGIENIYDMRKNTLQTDIMLRKGLLCDVICILDGYYIGKWHEYDGV